MSMIIVTPLSALKTGIRRYQPSHVITLLSPEHMIDTPQGVDPLHHLRIAVNDVSDPATAEQPPAPNHVEAILTFAGNWTADKPLLVRYADIHLGRDGAMVRAVEGMGRGLVVAEGECVELPLDLDEL